MLKYDQIIFPLDLDSYVKFINIVNLLNDIGYETTHPFFAYYGHIDPVELYGQLSFVDYEFYDYDKIPEGWHIDEEDNHILCPDDDVSIGKSMDNLYDWTEKLKKEAEKCEKSKMIR